jgi:plastocyanin/uncharacterized membrane protein
MSFASTVFPAARFARREILFCLLLLVTSCLLWGMSPWVTGASASQNQESSASASQSGAVEVVIKNFRFQPAQISVHPGETVEFKNEDIFAHTATADDGSFDSGLIQPGSSWKLTVAKAGTIAYHCTPHPNMKATLVAASGAAGQPASGSEAGPSPRFNPPTSPQEFHPILVNFTAALLPLALLSDLLGLWSKRASLHNAASWMVVYAAVLTPFTAAAGWWWKSKSAGALPASVIVVHEWLGTSLAVIFILLAIWRWRPHNRNAAPSAVYLVITAIVVLALIYQGSLGGLMVFGR